MSGGRTRLGVIGAGRWGRNIIATLRGMPAAEVAGVASRNPATRDLLDARCVLEPEWRRLLRHPGLDGVIVAAPPALHAEMAAEALRAGLPVFVEKPLTCDVGEAERLFDLAAAKHGYVLVDHVHLFSRAYQTLKGRLPDIGPIARVQAEAGAWGPFRADTPVLWDWGPHDAAFCVDLLGARPDALRAERIERRPVEGAWGETLALRADYPAAVTADVRVSNLLAARRRRLRVDGPGGALVYDDCAESRLTCAAPGGGATSVDTAYVPPLECALSRFVANVSTGRMSLDDLRFGVEVVRLLAGWEARLG